MLEKIQLINNKTLDSQNYKQKDANTDYIEKV